MVLVEVRHIENFLTGDGRFYGGKSLLSGYIIIKKTYDSVVKFEIVCGSPEIVYRVQDHNITGRSFRGLEYLPGEKVKESLEHQYRRRGWHYGPASICIYGCDSGFCRGFEARRRLQRITSCIVLEAYEGVSLPFVIISDNIFFRA